MVKNSIVLQVTATRSQSDAMALADELQQKKFPSFVVTPTADAFYRVQVGPYSSEAEADAAKRALDREGFKRYHQALNEFPLAYASAARSR